MELTKSQIERVKKLVYKHTGIVLGDSKEIMIKNRLNKLLGCGFCGKNVESVLSAIENGEHIESFVNVFTTNKTDFFRESFHFDDLRDRVIPELLQRGDGGAIYSSASSSGEEPYSIAMTLFSVANSIGINPKKIKIKATDIDTNILRKAKDGVYQFSPGSSPFPRWIAPQKFFKRRILDEASGDSLIKVKDEIKELVEFGVLNLFDATYPFKAEEFDVIFCRNVLIYFSADDQTKIVTRLLRHLKMGGTLYLGHSESPLSAGKYLERIGHNIFIKIEEV